MRDSFARRQAQQPPGLGADMTRPPSAWRRVLEGMRLAAEGILGSGEYETHPGGVPARMGARHVRDHRGDP